MTSLPASDRPGARAIAGAQRGWWLEDAAPGRLIRHPGGRTITAGEHVWLAWITHNLSDIHGNADAARQNEWGQPLVLGMLTAAILLGLAQPAAGPPESFIGEGRTWPSIKLQHPVVEGDSIRAESLVHDVTLDATRDMGRVRRTISGYDQRDRVVAMIEEDLRVPSRRALAR